MLFLQNRFPDHVFLVFLPAKFSIYLLFSLLVGRVERGTSRMEGLKLLKEELVPRPQMNEREAAARRAVGTRRTQQ